MILPTRAEVGRRLAAELNRYQDQSPVIMALSPGSISVAYQVARALRAPLDVMAVKRVGVPGRRECVIGAIAPGAVVLNDRVQELSLPQGYVDNLLQLEMKELDRRARLLRDEHLPISLAGRTVLLVEDGRLTCWEVAAAIEAARKAGARRVVFATPTCATETAELARPRADEFVTLCAPAERRSFVMCHENFVQTTGEEAQSLIEESRERKTSPPMAIAADVVRQMERRHSRPQPRAGHPVGA